jgi:predicted transcriptional regulator
MSERPAVPTALAGPRSKCVYLYLDSVGATTAAELTVALDMPRLTLYPVLDRMEQRGLIEYDGTACRLAADSSSAVAEPVSTTQ